MRPVIEFTRLAAEPRAEPTTFAAFRMVEVCESARVFAASFSSASNQSTSGVPRGQPRSIQSWYARSRISCFSCCTFSVSSTIPLSVPAVGPFLGQLRICDLRGFPCKVYQFSNILALPHNLHEVPCDLVSHDSGEHQKRVLGRLKKGFDLLLSGYQELRDVAG